MIDQIIGFSIKNKLTVGIAILALVGWGAYSFKQIPIDAVPDITTNQVQILTQSPTLAAQEVEQFVTFPIEMAMSNLPEVVEIRSISRFGISVITVVFEEDFDIYLARQLISEQLSIARANIPDGFGDPELGPITTGLGEVYQYVLHTEPEFEDQYSDMDLRTINDWIVQRLMAGTPGVIETSGWGGHLKQYEVAINPEHLHSMNISIAEVFDALQSNNENTGGSYIERKYNTYFIRGDGLVKSLDDINKIVVKTVDGIPILVRDIATVGFGSAPRYGAITWNGHGEVVGGQMLMLKGENSFEVVKAIKERIKIVRAALPEGIILEPFIDRSELIGRAFSTVTENLILGGLIVIIILILLLGNVRGGIIVASTIPLSMLVALGLMNVFGVSANLMSLGALDFGIIVDGAVIIVESVVFYLATHYEKGKKLSADERDKIALTSSSKMMRSAFFGQLIILIVFIPILALTGIEGKMFRPMAQVLSFAMIGAIILSLTYVPMMSAWFLRQNTSDKKSFSDKVVEGLGKMFDPVIRFALNQRWLTLGLAASLLIGSGFMYSKLGGEFIPTLEEGDFALHQILPPGSSLSQSVEVSEKIQSALLDNFPEVITVVSKIGSAEIPTDPMPIEVGDIMVKMKPKSEWVSASTKEEMFEKMEAVLSQIPGVEYEFTQPIQMRFNELISGVREDVAIKIFGENSEILYDQAKQAEKIINSIEGVGDLQVERTQGLPQMMVIYERNKIAQYGLNISDLNMTLRTAFAGETAGVVFEGERRFDLVVRLDKRYRTDIDNIRNLFVSLPNGNQIPLKEVARIEFKDGPMQISRENAKRRITIGVNARGRDVESLVDEIREKLEAGLSLPPGYYIAYGGTFENLQQAKDRLSVAVPVALMLIFVLVFFALKSLKQTVMIYMSIPLAAMGGIFFLWVRDMPFSISAGVGFIVLSGVAVLNGLVLISSLNELKEEGVTDLATLIIQGTKRRIRPILLTASTDILGFLPMALSTSAGAEVQRPLATVVIGGLFTATILTLLVIPVLYSISERISFRPAAPKAFVLIALLCLGFGTMNAQSADTLSLQTAVNIAFENHPSLAAAELDIERARKLKKTAFDLENTNFNYSHGQLNSSLIDYNWSITQGFKFPTTYISQSRLMKEKVELSQRKMAVSQLELEHKVHRAYWQFVYGNEKLDVLTELAEAYKEFAEATRKRYEAGEINFYEKTSSQGEHMQIQMLKQQAELDLVIFKKQLNQWMGLDTNFVLGENAFYKIALPEGLNVNLDGSPIVMVHKQNMNVTAQEVKLEKSGFLPDLNIGYFNQQIDGLGGLDGVQFGVGIPLFFWTQQGKLQAAKIGNQIAGANYDAHVLEINTMYEIKKLEVQKHQMQLDWFDTQGLKNADELLRYAKIGYESGELDYLSFLSSTRQAVNMKVEHLNVLNQYNQTVTDLHYLKGSFKK